MFKMVLYPLNCNNDRSILHIYKLEFSLQKFVFCRNFANIANDSSVFRNFHRQEYFFPFKG